MSLKNFSREATTRNGKKTWRLRTNQGDEFEAFTRYADFVERYPARTTKVYLEAVGRFLDYLWEAGVFAPNPLSIRKLNSVIDAYPILLRDGSEQTAERLKTQKHSSPDDAWLIDTARALNWKPHRRATVNSTLAAVDKFLQLSASLAREELERAQLLGVPHDNTSQSLIRALLHPVAISPFEVQRMRQNSMLGSVAKYCPDGVTRPSGLAGRGGQPQQDNRFKDFPLEFLDALISAATCWRDRALWLLLAASGIRTSEARNLLLADLCMTTHKVYVRDPDGRRVAPKASLLEEPRFKGRTIAATYLYPPLRQKFFEALEQYLKLEYVPTSDGHLFQYVEPNRRGEPFVHASDSTLAKSFKKAVARAGVPLVEGGGVLTPHSLRHSYGVYMLNDYPLDPKNGRYGLPITDVQLLMGHARLSNTQKYARRKSERLMQALQASDEEMLNEWQHLPPSLTARLEHQHD